MRRSLISPTIALENDQNSIEIIDKLCMKSVDLLEGYTYR